MVQIQQNQHNVKLNYGLQVAKLLIIKNQEKIGYTNNKKYQIMKIILSINVCDAYLCLRHFMINQILFA